MPVIGPPAGLRISRYLDYDPADYIIKPCDACVSWWAEVVHQDTEQPLVREWHDPRCPVLTEWE